MKAQIKWEQLFHENIENQAEIEKWASSQADQAIKIRDKLNDLRQAWRQDADRLDLKQLMLPDAGFTIKILDYATSGYLTYTTRTWRSEVLWIRAGRPIKRCIATVGIRIGLINFWLDVDGILLELEFVED